MKGPSVQQHFFYEIDAAGRLCRGIFQRTHAGPRVVLPATPTLPSEWSPELAAAHALGRFAKGLVR